jgi:hypothetical protein
VSAECITPANGDNWFEAQTVLQSPLHATRPTPRPRTAPTTRPTVCTLAFWIGQVLDELVDEFADPSHSLGVQCSPMVHLELQPYTRLGDKIELILPHCFAAKEQQMEHKDVRDVCVVAYSSLAAAEWQLVEDDDFELLDAAESPNGLPSVRVRVLQGGVVGVFGHAHFPVTQVRVERAFASSPSRTRTRMRSCC